MANDLDKVPVLVGDLRGLERVLENALGLVTADDLARQFRSMSGRPAPSHLARALDTSLNNIRAYLDPEEENEATTSD